MVFLSEEAKVKILRRKYCGSMLFSWFIFSLVDDSILVKYILGPFWDKCVTMFPWNLAPNVITLSGFAFMLVASIALLVYSETREGFIFKVINSVTIDVMNGWIFRSLSLLYGICLFIYQIFGVLFQIIFIRQLWRETSTPCGHRIFTWRATWSLYW